MDWHADATQVKRLKVGFSNRRQNIYAVGGYNFRRLAIAIQIPNVSVWKLNLKISPETKGP